MIDHLSADGAKHALGNRTWARNLQEMLAVAFAHDDLPTNPRRRRTRHLQAILHAIFLIASAILNAYFFIDVIGFGNYLYANAQNDSA
jgi:hypothetical protein